MPEKLLEIQGLTAQTNGKEILHGVNLSIGRGEIHVLMGPNGAGKSTLGNVLMGHPAYTAQAEKMLYRGESLEGKSADERARAGMFLSFQNPVEVPGITLASFIRSAIEARTGKRVMPFAYRKRLLAGMRLLQMDEAYAERDLNVGFSGGEKKKAEILQLLMLEPEFAILDETDSGLDVDAVRTVSEGVREYMKEPGRSLLIITHSTRILEALHTDYTHILVDGRIVAEGDASLVDEINREGFESYE